MTVVQRGRSGGRSIRSELLNLLELGGQLIGKGLFEGLFKQISHEPSEMIWDEYLSFASGIGAQAIEGSGVYSWLDGSRGGSERGGS